MPVLLFVPYYAFRANSTVITNAFHRLPAISKTFELSVRISARLPACPSFNSLRGRYHHCYHSFPQMRPIEESRFRAFLSNPCLRARVKQGETGEGGRARIDAWNRREGGGGGEGDEGSNGNRQSCFPPLNAWLWVRASIPRGKRDELCLILFVG